MERRCWVNDLCTIAIAVWNKPDITRQCLESVAAHTEYPHELLLIDNGSGRPTKKLLEDFCRGKTNCRIKRFDENAGYLKAANFALETLDTSYICLLNNDTIVTDGWLSECIRILGSCGDIGIVSPTTNEISDHFRTAFLSGCTRALKGKSVEVNSGLGSCFILKKEVVKKIGLFDPVYMSGYFEEVDYSFKAASFGFKSVMALGAYIEHLSNASFSVMPEERKRLWHENRSIFESRWGRSERILVFVKGDYGKDVLLKRREYLLDKCRHRAIVELYCKRDDEWARGVHFNIRHKKSPLYAGLILCFMIRMKKKAYDTVITDIRVPPFLLKLFGIDLKGFYDFAGLKALDADADPLRGAVH